MEFQLSRCVNEKEHADEEVLYKHWHYYRENEQWVLLPHPKEILPHTITLHPPNFTCFLTPWGDKHSPFLRLTNILPSDRNKLNLDSSLKWAIFHCSSVYTICSLAKSRRTFWFFFEIKVLRHGIRATIFSLFNLRETVFLEIGFPVYSQNAREVDVAVSKRFFNDILTIIRSSHLVVI